MVNTQVRPLTVDDYHRMIETGIIQEEEPIELISGQIFTIAAKVLTETPKLRSMQPPESMNIGSLI